MRNEEISEENVEDNVSGWKERDADLGDERVMDDEMKLRNYLLSFCLFFAKHSMIFHCVANSIFFLIYMAL